MTLDLVLDTRLQAEDTNLTIPTSIEDTNTLSYNEAVPDKTFGSEENKHILRSEDDNSNEDNTLELLIKYSRMGFKPVPLRNDSIPAVSSTNEIYNNFDYWTEEKLTQNYWRFSNIATTFGVTHVQTVQGNKNDKLYLHCLDIDSDNVLAILFDLLNEFAHILSLQAEVLFLIYLTIF